MNIKIWQINLSRDKNRVAFFGLEALLRLQGSRDVDPAIYDLVFEGIVNANHLEAVYRIFNDGNAPATYCGRSMSVSDVIEVIDHDTSEFFYCDDIGFKKVLFKRR